jgi:hypothetical protein
MAAATLQGLLAGRAPSGVVVRVHSFHRSSLSPLFYELTRLSAVPGVDYTFDADVCDGTEKVRGAGLLE